MEDEDDHDESMNAIQNGYENHEDEEDDLSNPATPLVSSNLNSPPPTPLVINNNL